MGFKSQEFECPDCKTQINELIERNEPVPEIYCVDCQVVMPAVMSAPMIMQAAYPDGTKRFDGLRESMKLKRAAAKARREGNFGLAAEIKKEKHDRDTR